MKDLVEKYDTARKKVMKRGGSEVDEGWLHSLFDVCTCKCFIPESPVVHSKKCTCSCEVADRIPVKEISFLQDQRNDRKMYIGVLDMSHTKKEIERGKHKRKREVNKEVNNPALLV